MKQKLKLFNSLLALFVVLTLLLSLNPAANAVNIETSSNVLDTVSSNGTTTPYITPKSSINQTSGYEGTGLSTGEITPVIPDDVRTFDGSSPKTIIGTDNRVKVTNTTAYPYRTSAFLLLKFPSGRTYLGSGHIISADTVLTAGHCVYDPSEGGWAKVEVYPGYNGTTAPYGVANSTQIFSVSGWTSGRSSEHDIAAIKLDRPIGVQTGWLPVADMASGAITITGYPGEMARQMYTMSGNIASVSLNNTYYTIDTTGGNSGSGVYNNNNQIVAVHAYGSSSQNFGTRINSEKLGIVNSWINNGMRSGTYFIRSLRSGQYLDAAATSYTNLIQHYFVGGNNQKFTVQNNSLKCVQNNKYLNQGSASSGYYSAILSNSSIPVYFCKNSDGSYCILRYENNVLKALDVRGGSTECYAEVGWYNYNGNANQKWIFEDGKQATVTPGTYYLINRKSGLYLDLYQEAGELIQFNFNGGNNQKWEISKTGSGNYKIKTKSTQRPGYITFNSSYSEMKCIITTSGTEIGIYRHNDGYYRLMTPNNIYSIAVKNASLTSGEYAIWNEYDYNTNEQWELRVAQ